MMRILMILALCASASAPQAQTELTPAMFDLQDQFNHCLSDPQTANYQSCRTVLEHSFTLRREIGHALQACLTSNATDCTAPFNAAGLPADRLNLTTLDHCTLLGDLDQIDIAYLPENACIEKLADLIERDTIPTRHDTDISCDKTYVACIEIGGVSAKYWRNAAWISLLDQQQAIIASNDTTLDIRYQQYSLIERQHRQQIELAKTTCTLQTLGQQRNSARDFESCMAAAYADIWQAMQTE